MSGAMLLSAQEPFKELRVLVLLTAPVLTLGVGSGVGRPQRSPLLGAGWSRCKLGCFDVQQIGQARPIQYYAAGYNS
jgi:hypothetical protein